MSQRLRVKTKSAILGISDKRYNFTLDRITCTGLLWRPEVRRLFQNNSKRGLSRSPVRRSQPTPSLDDEKSTQSRSDRNVYSSTPELPSEPAKRDAHKSSRPRLRKDGSKWLQELIAKKEPSDENLTQILAKLSKHKEGYQPWASRRLPALQKLEHNVSATSSIAKFDTTQKEKSNLGSSRLLREVLQIQQRADKREIESIDQYAELIDLPISPLLHPRLTEIRKHMMAKPSSPKPDAMTAFERQLLVNPFARMLSSEVRSCMLTGMRLPAALLTKFALKLDPNTGRPWLVPSGFEPSEGELAFWERVSENSKWHDASPLSLRPLPDLVGGDRPIEERSAREAFEIQSFDEDGQLSLKTNGPSLCGLEAVSQTDCPTSEAGHQLSAVNVSESGGYISSTWAGLRYVSENRQKIGRFLPVRWRTELKSAVNDVVVRPHMGEYIKKLLSYRLARQLAWMQDEHGSPAIIKWTGVISSRRHSNGRIELVAKRKLSENSYSKVNIAAILWFGGEYSNAQKDVRKEIQHRDALDRVQTAASDEPRVGATIPLYNLRKLMGETEFGWLRALSHKKGLACANYAVAITEDPVTVGVLRLAWQLQQYTTPGRLEEATVILEDSDC